MNIWFNDLDTINFVKIEGFCRVTIKIGGQRYTADKDSFEECVSSIRDMIDKLSRPDVREGQSNRR